MHTQAGLDIVKVKLHPPALLIPPGDLRGVVDVLIEQGGDDLQLLCAHAGSGARNFDQSQIQRGRQGGVLRFMLTLHRLQRPTPGDAPVVVSDAAALLHLRVACLMQAHDHIDSACFAGGDEGVGAEGAISDEDVALAQMFEHAPREPSVVRARLAFAAAIQVPPFRSKRPSTGMSGKPQPVFCWGP